MGVWIMAAVTFREAARKKMLWMALAAGGAFLILFGTGLHFQAKDFAAHGMSPVLRREISFTMVTMGLYAVDLLAVLMTILTSIDTLSGEIASGTIQAIATKPVPRWQVLLGKWFGFLGMLTAYIAIMVVGVNAITYAMAGVTARHLASGLSLMWMESVVLLSVTFAFATYFSTLTTGVLTLGLHGLAFLGGWIEQFGAITQTQRAVNVGVIASVLMPSEALWRRAAFEMQSPLASAMRISPFSTLSVPSTAMIFYAAIYLTIALVIAIRRFSQRDF
ncbi:MAG: ABC transporter permease [Acidobacteria bacterium]|jgi:ABC-type transport system involved in multi-copper enzyme maturation permease subunit|nr:MAG: ABC transporter permease [Acidobacteriota bacterium]